MGRIQSTIGLISGIDYGKIVDQLVALSRRPVDQLTSRNETLKKQQVAVTELSAYLLAVRYASDNLAKSEIYQKSKVSTSNEAALQAAVTGAPAAGYYQFTPIRTAQQQQFLSAGLRSSTSPLGGGTLTIRFGNHVERAASLDALNGGQGVQRGKIRITDRSGASSEIDLTGVQTIDDVLDAINNASGINVTASTRGGAIRLTDHTGQAVSNLKVQEVGRGTTAASLGLAGIDAAAAVADGADVLKLSADTPLSQLNDGRGVRLSTVLPDIAFTLRDGTTGSIDFSPLGTEGEKPPQETTVGDLLQVLNAAAPGKLKAEIAPDGKRLVVTDLTAGEGSFSLQSMYGIQALADLGLDTGAAAGVVSGRAVVGGLRTVLLSGLNGGKGLGPLGQLRLTNRNGDSTVVDLAAAETLEDVVAAIQGAAAGISARVNDARNGILLTDVTGGSASPMIVADADASGTAAKLKIAANTASGIVNSGDLRLQVVSENTRLSDLNGGAGVALGKFAITSSGGRRAEIDLAKNKAQTVGDVIKLINQFSGTTLAKINDAGDGILLVDLEHGSGAFAVSEVNSTTAADLGLARAAISGDYGGAPANLIDGTTTRTIQLDASDTLESLRNKIASSGIRVTASVLDDGSSRPYHLALTSQRSGRLGQFVVDASQIGALAFAETARGRDALLAAASGGANAGLLLASPTNQFKSALPGLVLDVRQPSATPVTVAVESSDADVVASAQAMVDNYNRFRQKYNEYTKYDTVTNEAGLLFGDAAALRMDNDFSGLFTGRLAGLGSVQTLADVGIRLKSDGTLAFDSATLKARFAADPAAVKDFFATADKGFAAKISALIEQISGKDVSMLAQRFKALDATISRNQTAIDAMTARLARQRERLEAEFLRVETAVAKMQNSLAMLNAMLSGQVAPTKNSSNSSSSNSSSTR